MRPGDGQLSLFEADAIDQAQSMQVPGAACAALDQSGASEAGQPTRTAGPTPEPDSPRRPPHDRLATDPGRAHAPERVPVREPRRRSPASVPLLSPEDVARRCGVSRKAIYRAVARGELRAARILSRLRIDPGDLEAWLRANVIDAQSPTPSPVALRLPPSTGLRRLLPEP
jgi:excisionase family DNA binding protein